MHAQSTAALAQDLSQALSALLFEAQRSFKDNPISSERCIGRAVDLLARVGQPETTARQSSSGLPPWRAHRVRQVIEAEIGKTLTSTDLANAAGLSPSHFARAFKVSFGCTPHQYLMRARIERAKRLMLTSVDALSDIALACGLADQSHFSRLFQRLEGETPTTWRRRQTQEGSTS